MRTDLIIQLSTGGAVTDSFDDRLAVLEAAPDACSLTCGTVNFGDEVFANPWPFIRELYARTQAAGVVPEFELFDLGQVATLHRLLDELGAAARRPRALRPGDGRARRDAGHRGRAGRGGGRAARRRRRGRPPGSGGPRCRSLLGALGAGGHLRVGMEDTTSFARGRPVAGNAELVERAAALAGLAQRPPLAPDEARADAGGEQPSLNRPFSPRSSGRGSSSRGTAFRCG